MNDLRVECVVCAREGLDENCYECDGKGFLDYPVNLLYKLKSVIDEFNEENK